MWLQTLSCVWIIAPARVTRHGLAGDVIMEPLETAATFSTRVKAELALRWLEHEGVPARLIELPARDERIAARLLEERAGGATSGVLVKVAPEDLGRARYILAREGGEDGDLPATGITAFPERVIRKSEVADPPATEQDVV